MNFYKLLGSKKNFPTSAPSQTPKTTPRFGCFCPKSGFVRHEKTALHVPTMSFQTKNRGVRKI